MQDVPLVETHSNHLFLDTGSPHHVELVSNLNEHEVKTNGSKIRYGQPYNEAGSNVNFVEQVATDSFAVRTYERGVEDETLSCGTGVTAVAIAMYASGKTKSNSVKLQTPGGELMVTFKNNDKAYEDIWLSGPATQVFKGEIEW